VSVQAASVQTASAQAASGRVKNGFGPAARRAGPFMILIAILASVLFLYKNRDSVCLNPFEEVVLTNILKARTDRAGDVYIIDSGMARIVRMNPDGRADYEIKGGYAGAVFYNAWDIAVEYDKSLYVHEVAWDSSGMRVEAERILEFDKRSGAFRRELYRLDRSGGGNPTPALSALIRLCALRFQDGKLWFAQKNQDDFVLYSLVPGDDVKEELACPYGEALRTLDDFSVDPARKSVYFADKAGNVRVFTPDGVRTLYVPVSGNTVREFSLPYQLSHDGSSLYFSDIGKRAILRLEREGEAEIVFGGWGAGNRNSALPALCHSVHSRGGLLTLAGDDFVVGFDPSAGEEVFRASSLPASHAIAMRRVCFQAVAFVLLCSLFLVCRAAFVHVKSGKMSRKEQFSCVAIAGMLLVFLSTAPTILDALRVEVRSETMNRLNHLMEISPKILNSEALAGIRTPQDYDGPAYRDFMRSLHNLLERENEWNWRIYCDIYKFQDGILYGTGYLDGTTGAFSTPVEFEGSNAWKTAESGEWIENMELHNQSGTYMSLSGPIRNVAGGVEGILEIGVDMNSMETSIYLLMRRMMTHTLLIIALLVLLVSEMIESAHLSGINGRRRLYAPLPFSRIRPFVFVSFMTFNLATGFIPNYALNIGGSFQGLSPETSAILPMVAGNVMLAVAPLISPRLMTTLGLRWSFAAGALSGALGYAMSAAASSITPLIAGMSCVGLGAGVVFTILQIYIASLDDADDRELGFSSYAASCFSGINCGIMTGGIIATEMGQNAVFYVGVLLWLCAAFLFLLSTRQKDAHQFSELSRSPRPRAAGDATRGAFPGGVLAFFFLLFFPFTLYSGFMYYLVPIFGNRGGLSETEVSLVFVLYGIGVSFFGPRVSAFARGISDKISFYLWAALVIELAGIICFALSPATGTMLAAAFILGCACSVGYTYFPLYLTEMPEAKKLSRGMDMGLLSFTESLGCVAGPLIFSAVLGSGGSYGYYALTASMLLAAAAYHGLRRRAMRAA